MYPSQNSMLRKVNWSLALDSERQNAGFLRDENGIWYILDRDGDGIADTLEESSWNQLDTHGNRDQSASNPDDADTDDDGILDTYESVHVVDNRLISLYSRMGYANNPDSDGDGLPDGLEIGMDDYKRTTIQQEIIWIGKDPYADTDKTKTFLFILNGREIHRPCFIQDLDPLSTTSPREKDTNNNGIDDGAEDINANGRCDDGESDPSAGIVGMRECHWAGLFEEHPQNIVLKLNDVTDVNFVVQTAEGTDFPEIDFIPKTESHLAMWGSMPDPIVYVWQRFLGPHNRAWLIRVENAGCPGKGDLKIRIPKRNPPEIVIPVEVIARAK
ncbi:hypothetical protein HYR69_09190 [Candidatus Sumerlaeota bacterium]|nr:hypothetical protein [Candidatus Sumerlaeota bacterium]